jgi:hypothetical protein
MRRRTLIRKTSLLRKIEPIARRSSFANKDHLQLAHLAMSERRNDSGDSEGPRKNLCTIQPGSISSLRCQKSRMSRSIRTSECGTMFSRTISLSIGLMARLRQGYGVAAFAAGLPSRSWLQPAKAGGARRDRTDDLMLAKHALSQLSYGPVTRRRNARQRFVVLAFAQGLRRSSLRRRRLAWPKRRRREGWWAWEDLNFRPHAYQARALTN